MYKGGGMPMSYKVYEILLLYLTYPNFNFHNSFAPMKCGSNSECIIFKYILIVVILALSLK